MKKIAFVLVAALLMPLCVTAQKKKKADVRTFNDCYIYGNSNRNAAKKGSAMSLTDGTTYSLENAYNIAGEKYIDVMLFHGKAYGGKEYVFHLFAPDDPSITINWQKDGGTSPYCKFEGKGEQPDSYFALKNWKKRNATKLVKVTGVDFDNIDSEAIAALPIEDSYHASDIKVGDIILFELAATSAKPGKKGLMKITAIENDPDKPDKRGDGKYQKMIMDIKIQK
ncbi:MAG: hypothetical protein LBR81_03450 [Prevotellaceae bacterium]|jgi:hypothetical protein|nr:hypothetical protein [Prevotellaceae bacterium]